jgi:hypothetical protein
VQAPVVRVGSSTAQVPAVLPNNSKYGSTSAPTSRGHAWPDQAWSVARCLAPGRQAGRPAGCMMVAPGRCAAASMAQQAVPSAAVVRLQRGAPARGCFSSVGGSPQAILIQKSRCGGLWGLLRMPLALVSSRCSSCCKQERLCRICQLMALPSAQGFGMRAFLPGTDSSATCRACSTRTSVARARSAAWMGASQHSHAEHDRFQSHSGSAATATFNATMARQQRLPIPCEALKLELQVDGGAA